MQLNRASDVNVLQMQDPTDLGDVLHKVFSERQPAADEPHGDHVMG